MGTHKDYVLVREVQLENLAAILEDLATAVGGVEARTLKAWSTEIRLWVEV